MPATVTPRSIPADSEIARRLAGAHFHDCHERVVTGAGTALEHYLAIVGRTPRWIDAAMALRNRAVRLVGLKDIGALGGVDRGRRAADYRVGDRVGIFSLLYLSDDEIILGDADRHLDAQVAVFRRQHDGRDWLGIATVVHIHNLLGRAYMLVVTPMHRLIAPAMLARAGIAS